MSEKLAKELGIPTAESGEKLKAQRILNLKLERNRKIPKSFLLTEKKLKKIMEKKFKGTRHLCQFYEISSIRTHKNNIIRGSNLFCHLTPLPIPLLSACFLTKPSFT